MLWSWSNGSCIYNYLCNLCLSRLMLCVRILIRARCTTLCDGVCEWLAAGRWFTLYLPVFSINKTDRHEVTEILSQCIIGQFWKTEVAVLSDQVRLVACRNFDIFGWLSVIYSLKMDQLKQQKWKKYCKGMSFIFRIR
jgi:hypothetical protein